MPTPRSESVDVVIVGAGLAGLSAAEALATRGINVMVVEATERVGGRTCTVEMHGRRVDLGGQWIGEHQVHVLRAAAKSGIQLYDQYSTGRKIVDVDGEISYHTGDIPKVGVFPAIDLSIMLARSEYAGIGVPADMSKFTSAHKEQDSVSAQFNAGRARTKITRVLHNLACRNIAGTEDKEISYLHLLSYARSSGGMHNLVDGNNKWKTVQGTQTISEGLADIVGRDRIVMNAPVHHVAQSEAGVVVHHSKGSISAKYAIITIPLPLLKSIKFTPSLPADKTELIEKCFMGDLIKCVIRYETAFWREQGFAGEVLTDREPLNFIYDHCSAGGLYPALVIFIGGEPARRWAKKTFEERRKAVLGQVAFFFGEKALHPLEYRDKNWPNEPYSGGAPVVNYPPGVLARLGGSISKPTGRIFWAGTDTATVSRGYMDGAVQSGERAANEVLKEGEWAVEPVIAPSPPKRMNFALVAAILVSLTATAVASVYM